MSASPVQIRKGVILVEKEVKIGDHVIWGDQYGKPHHALVTNVWGPADSKPSINVRVVDSDPNQEDSCGRKTRAETSVTHKSNQSAHGRWWDFPA